MNYIFLALISFFNLNAFADSNEGWKDLGKQYEVAIEYAQRAPRYSGNIINLSLEIFESRAQLPGGSLQAQYENLIQFASKYLRKNNSDAIIYADRVFKKLAIPNGKTVPHQYADLFKFAEKNYGAMDVMMRGKWADDVLAQRVNLK